VHGTSAADEELEDLHARGRVRHDAAMSREQRIFMGWIGDRR
jgi:hypothetical protein